MGVFMTSFRPWPHSRVPYVCSDAWASKRIEEFQRALGKTLFLVRRFDQPNYVDFRPGGEHSSDIGMKGGPQVLGYEPRSYYSLFHEMGHCLGLGHEYFHHRWPYRAALLDANSLHTMAFQASVGKYTAFGDFDSESIMSYSPASLGIHAGTVFMLPQTLSAGDKALIRYLYPDALPF